MNFYERYKDWCTSIGKTPTAVAIEVGIGRATVSNWKNHDTSPTVKMVEKLADYFGCSVDFFLNGSAPERPTPTSDTEIDEILQAVRDNPALKMLFSVSKGATADDINKTVAILERLKGTNNDM